ncbi:MAG: CBS domain-containing protein [Peptococcaceae bacterium]|nr:CBS domain-containing protein [Peptococcaceae bacterium]
MTVSKPPGYIFNRDIYQEVAAFNALEILVKLIPLEKLPGELLSKIAESVEVKVFPRGAYVFRQGDPGHGCLYFIHRGSAEVTVTNEIGNETVISYRYDQDFFGETGFFGETRYTGSVRAREELVCLLIPGHVFELLVETVPDFAKNFIRIATERMRHLYGEIVEEQSQEQFPAGDSTIFRKRLGEIMSSPVITCRTDESVRAVARTMAAHGISSVIVVDGENRPAGLITERDLVRKVLAREEEDMQDLSAGAVMNPALVKLPANGFFYEALQAVVRDQATHLAVMDGEKLVGIISLRQLIKTRSTGTLWLSGRVRELSSKKDLPAAGRELESFLSALVAEKASITEIFEIMADVHDRLTRRIIRLCEEEMAGEGFGPPPAGYCWLEMGSSGRREQALRTDQDNAIVYEDIPGQEALAEDYFLRLGGKVVEWLTLSGFARCKGKVMADNPQWCMSLDRWKNATGIWIKRRSPDDIRKLTIFLDFRGLYGRLSLANSLRGHVLEAVRRSEAVAHLLTEDELAYRIPLSLWGNFITERSGPHRGEINLKNAACNHIVNCLRIFSIKHNVFETSTLGRLAALVKMGVIPEEDGEFLEAAYKTLMDLRLRENLRKVREGRAPDNYVNPHRLSRREQGLLKSAFQSIARLQKLTSAQFEMPWLR